MSDFLAQLFSSDFRARLLDTVFDSLTTHMSDNFGRYSMNYNVDEFGQPEAVDLATRRGDRVTEMWAWLVIDPEDDNEGILGAMSPLGGAFPLIGADRNRIESHREMAHAAGKAAGVEVRLVRFSCVEVLERLPPA